MPFVNENDIIETLNAPPSGSFVSPEDIVDGQPTNPNSAVSGMQPIPYVSKLPPDIQSYLNSVTDPQKEADKIKSSLSNSILLNIPLSEAYSYHDTIREEQKKRGIDLLKLKGTSTIGISPHKEIMRQQDIKAVRADIKKAPTDVPKGIVSGILGTAESELSGVEWLFDDVPGINKLATMAGEASKKLEKVREGYKTDSVVGDIASGVGSMATFLIPGTIVGKGLSTVAGVAPRLATWLGVSTMAAMEAFTEAGGVFKERRRVATEQGIEDPKSEAEAAAQFTFWTNIPLLVVTDKLGVFADKGSTLKKALKAYIFEGFGQESPQSVISNIAIDDPNNPLTASDVLYEGAIGGFSGAGGSLLLSHIENLADKSRKLKEMPQGVKAVYEGVVDGLEARGIDSETAHIEATKIVAQTKQGEEYIKQVADIAEAIIATEATVAKVEKESQDINTAIEEVGKVSLGPTPAIEQVNRVIDEISQGKDLTDEELVKIWDSIETSPSTDKQIVKGEVKTKSTVELIKELNDVIGEKGSIGEGEGQADILKVAPILIDIGKTVYTDGHQSYIQFKNKIKETLLGTTYDKVKNYIFKVWEMLKQFNEAIGIGGERGSFSTKTIIRENTGQVKPSEQIKETEALKAGMKKAEQAGKAGFKAGVEAGVEKALTPKPESVKQRIARVTGMAKDKASIGEDEALKAAFIKAARASQQAYRAGNIEGETKEKARTRELLTLKRELAVERANTAKAIKDIKDISELKGSIAVDYQKKIKAILQGLDFKKPTEAKLKELAGLKDFIEREGVPLGIKSKYIKEVDRLSKTVLKDMTPEDIKTLRDTLKHLEELGRLKANMKYAYNERERLKIETEIIETTKNIDPFTDQTQDRMRDKIKVAGWQLYLDTLSTVRVADTMDGFKNYKGAQARLKKQMGQAETEAVSKSIEREKVLYRKLQELGVQDIIEGSLSDIRMNIVIRYREGAMTQAETLMNKYKIEELPKLTAQEEKIIETIRADMEENKGTLAATWEEIEEDIFPDQEVYYLPLKYEGEEELIPEPTVGKHRTTQTFDGFSNKRRPGVKKLPRVGLLQLYHEAVMEQEWYKHIQPVVKDVASVVLTKKYKEAAGDMFTAWWKDDLDIMSRRGWGASAQMNPYTNMLRDVRHNINTAILAFKVSTVILQPFAIFDAIAVAHGKFKTNTTARIIEEVFKTLLVPGYKDTILESSAALRQRQGGELAITEEMTKATTDSIKDKLSRIGFKLITQMDVKTAAGVQNAIKKVIMEEEGLTETEAQIEAEFFMNLTQGSAMVSYRPHILAKGEGFRTWFTFQSFIMNRWGIIIHDLIASKIIKDPSISAKIAGLIGLGVLMLGGLGEDEARDLVNEWVRGKEHKDKFSIPTQAFLNITSTMPFFGQAIEAALTGGDVNPPVLKIFRKGGEGLVTAYTGKKAVTQIKGGLNAAESGLILLVGYPGTAQFFDLLEGMLSKENKIERR